MTDPENTSTPHGLPELADPGKAKAGFYRVPHGVTYVYQVYSRPPVRPITWKCAFTPEETFESPMVRWANLHYMGGYQKARMGADVFAGSVEHLEDLLEGRKPSGDVLVFPGWSADSYQLERARGLSTEWEKRLREAGLRVRRVSEAHHVKGKQFWRLIVAQNLKIREAFDLESWVSSWAAHGYDVGPLAKALGGRALISLVTAFHEDEAAWPPPITGLILGYPICSTVSFMRGA
jgi:hypothetical protein